MVHRGPKKEEPALPYEKILERCLSNLKPLQMWKFEGKGENEIWESEIKKNVQRMLRDGSIHNTPATVFASAKWKGFLPQLNSIVENCSDPEVVSFISKAYIEDNQIRINANQESVQMANKEFEKTKIYGIRMGLKSLI